MLKNQSHRVALHTKLDLLPVWLRRPTYVSVGPRPYKKGPTINDGANPVAYLLFVAVT